MNDYTLKRCSKCGEEKPLTPDYFRRKKSRKDGFDNRCKECMLAYHHEWHRKNPGKPREYRLNNYDKELEADRAYYRKNRERVSAKNKANRARLTAYMREWRAKSREYLRQYNREYGKKSHVIARKRHYQITHREQLSHNHRLYCIANPHIIKAINARRVARESSLPYIYETDYWRRALEYFHGCCAICGRQGKDLFKTHTLAADHWIAIKDPRLDNPGTVAWNIVPLCHGLGGCNNSKQDKDPIEWLIWRFGKRKAKTILRRIEAYFEWIIQFACND